MTLIILASLGWLLSVLGAVLSYTSAMTMEQNASEGTFTLTSHPKVAAAALVLIVGGASVGAAGTIVATLVAA